MAVVFDATGAGGFIHNETLSWAHTLSASSFAVVAGITGYGYAVAPTAWAKAVNIGVPVTFDAVGAGSNGSASPVTWTHTCGASASVILVAVSGYDSTGGVGNASFTWTVTYNGVALSPLGAVNLNNATATGFVMLFALFAPATGANTVSVGWTGGSGTLGVYASSVSYVGAGSVRVRSTGTGSSTTVTSGPIVSNAGDMMVAAQAAYNTTFSSPSDTQRYLQPTNSSNTHATLLIQDAPGIVGGYAMSASVGGFGGVNWGSVAVSLTPVTMAPMISLGAINLNNATNSNGFIQLWGLINPPTGALTVCASYFISGDTPYLNGNSVSYTGGTQFGTGVLNSGSSTALAAGSIVSATGNRVISIQGVYDQILTLSGTGTSRYNQPTSRTTNEITMLIQDIAGAATVALTSTAGATGTWGVASVNLVAGTQRVGSASLALTANVRTSGLFNIFPLKFPFVFGGAGPSGNVAWIGGASLALTANVRAAQSDAFPWVFPIYFGATGPVGSRLALGPPLRYVGRAPDSDAVIVPASYAVADNAATAVTLNYIDQQVAIQAADLVNNAWVNQQVANYTTQTQVNAALTSYVPNSALGAASGVAQLGSNEEIPSGQLPVLVTNNLAVCYDAVAVGTVYLASGSTNTVTSVNIGSYLIASVNIPDPGYPWIPLPFAYVRGYAGGIPSGSRLSGNGNSGLLTVISPVTISSPTIVAYAAGLMTGDTVPNYYQAVPYGAAGSVNSQDNAMTPLTQPPINGPLTLQLSASCWTGNSYVVSGTGLVFYVLVLPASGG